MKYRTLGQTGLKVSEVGIGAFPLSGMWRRPDGTLQGWSGTDDRESIALIHRAEELGINLIDSAEGYGDGHSEEVVGEALKGRRERWIIATKVQPNRGIDAAQPDLRAARQRIFSAAEDSLKRLRTDTIDVYQLHAIPHEATGPAVMEALAELRAQGKVRWYGISTNNRPAVDRLRTYGPIHVLQIGYNLLERKADGLLRWALKEDIGTLIRVPLAKGMLTGKYVGPDAARISENDVRYERYQKPESIDALKKLPHLNFLAEGTGRTMTQAALRFVLDHPGVSCVIAGAKSRAQIEQNAAATDVPPITEEERRKAFMIADTIRTPGWT